MLTLDLYTLKHEKVGKTLVTQEDTLFEVLEAVKEGFPVREIDGNFVWHNPRHVYTVKIEPIEAPNDPVEQTDKDNQGTETKSEEST